MSKADLSTATTDELVRELASRHEDVVVLTGARGKVKGRRYSVRYLGSLAAAIGLVEMAREEFMSTLGDDDSEGDDLAADEEVDD